MQLQESGEMYLETILILSKKIDGVHAIDVCDYMNYSKPSVSRALGILKKDGLVRVDSDDHISLTDSGMLIASKIYERHTMLRDFLIHLGVDEATATADACKIEHDISDAAFEAIKRHVGMIK